MCNKAIIKFVKHEFSIDEVKGKTVLDVGAMDINGSVRAAFVNRKKAGKYTGVDLEMGKGVDQVVNAEDLIKTFGVESFDIVASCEMLEHVRYWKPAIHNLKMVLKKTGLICITTRSFGFRRHGHPIDCWRYEIDDMKKIFSDFKIMRLCKDPIGKGVFMKAFKPENFVENSLDDILLYSMLESKRI